MKRSSPWLAEIMGPNRIPKTLDGTHRRPKKDGTGEINQSGSGYGSGYGDGEGAVPAGDGNGFG